MKLSNKILYCRKKAGLSQEALADIIGVFRQAISKWETGDAVPEISKLLLLAKAFQVTTDWLLSEDEPEQEKAPPEQKDYPQGAVPGSSSWVDSIPGVIGKLIRRYGWLYGVYTALAGLGFTIIGLLARVLTIRMFADDPFSIANSLGGNTIWYDEAGNIISSPFGSQIDSFATNNPVAIMGTVIMVIGIVLVIAGILLAIFLKTRPSDDQ